MVREINEAEANKTLIHLSKGELAPHLFTRNYAIYNKNVSEELDYFGYEEQKVFIRYVKQ